MDELKQIKQNLSDLWKHYKLLKTENNSLQKKVSQLDSENVLLKQLLNRYITKLNALEQNSSNNKINNKTKDKTNIININNIDDTIDINNIKHTSISKYA